MAKNQNQTIFILDASTVLEAILKQKYHEVAEKIFFLKDSYKISVLLPEIFYFEFFNVLSKEIGKDGAFETYKAFIEKQVSVVPLEADLIEEALDLIKKYPKISFYDASYHALAKAYHADFITADEKYYELTKKEGNIKLLKDLKI